MSLKSVFNAMKREGYIVKDLDMYLLSLNDEDNDRAINVNAPSSAGGCLRARYYSRTQAEANAMSIDARTRRIFDNGHGMHSRIQGYLTEMGSLLLDELPVLSEEYNIQGHTDGLLSLPQDEKAILELKSINSNGFTRLKSVKDEHMLQGLTYLYCVEERRKSLQEEYESLEEFLSYKDSRYIQYASFYPHLKSGRKYTREEKVLHQCKLHDLADTILIQTEKPITKVIFLYENKDSQELKEFLVSTKDANAQIALEGLLNDCAVLNEMVENKELPERCTNSKSDSACRWCNYSLECWN